LITSSLLFLLTLLVGTVPVYLYQRWIRKKKSEQQSNRKDNSGSAHEPILSANFYVQVVTQLGGGILFFTVLVHMIPEVRNNFEKYLKTNHSVFHDETKGSDPNSIEDLPLPYLEIAICVGFFSIYLAEVVMHSFLDRKHEPKAKKTSNLKDRTADNGLNNNKFESQSTVNNGSSRDEEEFDERSAIIRDDLAVLRQNRTPSHRSDEPVVIVIDHECDDVQEIEDRLLTRFLHGLVIIASFSIHSIFDGISIGVRSDRDEIWTIFIAIASHKLMIALIISVELYEKCRNFLLVVIHMILFSIMSPIGIWCVMLAEQTLDTHSEENPIVILLSALASGTILYIVFFEILQKNRVSKLQPIVQFIAMFIGFGLMFMITISLSED